jgi:hypothetical protein
MTHCGVGTSKILEYELHEKNPWEGMKSALITVYQAKEAYVDEVIAASHCVKQQLMFCRYSTCLQ